MRFQAIIRIAALLSLVSMLAAAATGCSPRWKEKFIRKHKVKAVEPILVLASDEEALLPPADRYREHFAFWKSWQLQLMEHLGTMRKRDIRNLSESVGELRAMAELLTGTPREELRKVTDELDDLEAKWRKKPSAGWHVSTATQSRLHQIKRLINRKYHYSRIKESVPGTEEASE